MVDAVDAHGAGLANGAGEYVAAYCATRLFANHHATLCGRVRVAFSAAHPVGQFRRAIDKSSTPNRGDYSQREGGFL